MKNLDVETINFLKHRTIAQALIFPCFVDQLLRRAWISSFLDIFDLPSIPTFFAWA